MSPRASFQRDEPLPCGHWDIEVAGSINGKHYAAEGWCAAEGGEVEDIEATCADCGAAIELTTKEESTAADLLTEAAIDAARDRHEEAR